MFINNKIKSFERLWKWLESLSFGVQNAAREMGRMLINQSESIAKERILSQDKKPRMRTGKYFQSIHSEFIEGDALSFSTGYLKSNSPIAPILEFGSRPHIIRARKKKYLFWPGAKHPVKQFNHPGTPPFRVLGNAVETASLQAKTKMEKALKKEFGTKQI
ncbi:MAG: hypothetical protein VW455_02315 [Nitrospinota bacterium]